MWSAHDNEKATARTALCNSLLDAFLQKSGVWLLWLGVQSLYLAGFASALKLYSRGNGEFMIFLIFFFYAENEAQIVEELIANRWNVMITEVNVPKEEIHLSEFVCKHFTYYEHSLSVKF